MPRPKRTWSPLHAMLVPPEMLAAMQAAAEAEAVTLAEWRRAAYEAAIRKAARRAPTPSPPK